MPHPNVCVSAAWRSIWRRSLRSSVSISSFLSSVVGSIYPCHSMRSELHRNEWLCGLSQISHEDNSAGWLASAILSLSFSPSLLSFPKRLLPLGLVTLDVSKASSLATREKEGGGGLLLVQDSRLMLSADRTCAVNLLKPTDLKQFSRGTQAENYNKPSKTRHVFIAAAVFLPTV